jgi:hypothetical protein
MQTRLDGELQRKDLVYRFSHIRCPTNASIQNYDWLCRVECWTDDVRIPACYVAP